MHAMTRRSGRHCTAPTACVPRALRNRWDKAAADKAAVAKAAAAKAAADKAAADKAAAEELRRRATALGLLPVLTTANIADDAMLKKSMAFCDEHGVTSVSDMVEYNLVQDFVHHLGLKTVPGKKLLSMLQTTTSGLAKVVPAAEPAALSLLLNHWGAAARRCLSTCVGGATALP